MPPEIKEEKKNTVTAQPRMQHHRRKSSEESQLGVASGKKKTSYLFSRETYTREHEFTVLSRKNFYGCFNENNE